jgi:hypothetical protein
MQLFNADKFVYQRTSNDMYGYFIIQSSLCVLFTSGGSKGGVGRQWTLRHQTIRNNKDLRLNRAFFILEEEGVWRQDIGAKN